MKVRSRTVTFLERAINLSLDILSKNKVPPTLSVYGTKVSKDVFKDEPTTSSSGCGTGKGL